MKTKIRGVELEVPEPRMLFATANEAQKELLDLMISVENEMVADGGRRLPWRSFYATFRTLWPIWSRYAPKE